MTTSLGRNDSAGSNHSMTIMNGQNTHNSIKNQPSSAPAPAAQSNSNTINDNQEQEHDHQSQPQQPRQERNSLLSRTTSTTSANTASTANSQQLTHRNNNDDNDNTIIDPPVLIYHESARSIVFRDHMRRAVKKEQEGDYELNRNNPKQTVTTAYVTELMDAKRDAMEYVPPDDMIAHNNKNKSDNNCQSDDHDNDNHNSIRNSNSNDDESISSSSDQLFTSMTSLSRTISNCFQPSITPLPKLALGPNDEFQALLQSPTGENGDMDPDWTLAERECVDILANQQAVLKTIKNVEWTPFLHRFQIPHNDGRRRQPSEHDDITPQEGHTFNSFVSSCTLLPPFGQKMRAYGSPTTYTAGVVFALPKVHHLGGNDNKNDRGIIISEDDAAQITKTWSWPAGYSAKTEFNIDGRGNLINGRDEARVPISELRKLNIDYLTQKDHMIAGRCIKGGLKTVPYNEIYVRVGGLGRIVNCQEVCTGEPRVDEGGTGRSFDKGLGLPVALFVRTATYGHLISMIRTRARLVHVLGEQRMRSIPLLFISPELGVRVLTEKLQATLLKDASQRLNPFQNPTIAHKTTVDSTGEEQLEQKLEELIDLDDTVRKLLTPEECARLAGGFGATDDSVAAILKEAMLADKKFEREHKNEDSVDHRKGHMLQDVVNEGLAAAVRSGDYYTSRQLLILYSLVASSAVEDKDEDIKNNKDSSPDKVESAKAKFLKDTTHVSELKESMNTLSTNLSPPPPPPLDTDRLRSATNSDGLLAVLGAAQVLKAMQDGSAKRRTDEVILALDEWIEHGEQSMAFRLASWRDQRAAQGDLKIAMERDSSFVAFVSNKAISNRKAFVSQLKQAAKSTDFCDVRFLSALEAILSRMHSPCLRLELLQYVLGLDNRYSVAHVARSVELAKTCLGIGGG